MSENYSEETNCIHGGGYYDGKKMGLGSVKPPIFQTSTFVFKDCEEGEIAFAKALGKIKKKVDEEEIFIYSRVNNPNLNIFEKRLAKIDGNEEAVSFNSGMSCINTVLMTFLKGINKDGIICFAPVYGGTHGLITKQLPSFGINVKLINADSSDCMKELNDYIFSKKNNEVNIANIKVIYCESPTNPSNKIIDLESLVSIRNEINKKKMEFFNKQELSVDEKCLVICDNTFLGPIFQKPSKFGVDINIYSATKFIGGHSDVIAGAATTNKVLAGKIKGTRVSFGSQNSPFDLFLLSRSLETLKIRMKKQQKNCLKVYKFLVDYQKNHPGIIKKILYPLALEKNSNDYKVFEKHCTGSGSLISLVLEGGKEQAHKVIDELKLITIAVSLGSTESLCCCPYSTTHQSVPDEDKKAFGIEASLVRISIGLESAKDLINDIGNALKILEKKK